MGSLRAETRIFHIAIQQEPLRKVMTISYSIFTKVVPTLEDQAEPDYL